MALEDGEESLERRCIEADRDPNTATALEHDLQRVTTNGRSYFDKGHRKPLRRSLRRGFPAPPSRGDTLRGSRIGPKTPGPPL